MPEPGPLPVKQVVLFNSGVGYFQREGQVTGWRDEDYPVAAAYGRPPLLRMERAGVPLFGVQGYGVHLNGYRRDGSRLDLWVGRRAPDKSVAPDKLDNLVAIVDQNGYQQTGATKVVSTDVLTFAPMVVRCLRTPS